MDKRFIRLGYAIEYPLALIALILLWTQAAGQAHADLVYWYWKLGITLTAAFACVKATQAALDGERAWNGRTLRWLAVVAILVVGAGLVTYYGHLYYEEQDTGDEEQEEPALTIDGVDISRVVWERREGLINPISHPPPPIS